MMQSRSAVMQRVLREHRAWIWPLGVLVVSNVLALVLGIVPMSRTVRAADLRAGQASSDRAAADAELAAMSSARDGRDGATRELAVFYRDGSGALALCYVACGRLIGYVELHINSWDCLGAIAVIDAAGGKVSDFLAGDSLWKGNALLAGSEKLFPQLQHLASSTLPQCFGR